MGDKVPAAAAISDDGGFNAQLAAAQQTLAAQGISTGAGSTLASVWGNSLSDDATVERGPREQKPFATSEQGTRAKFQGPVQGLGDFGRRVRQGVTQRPRVLTKDLLSEFVKKARHDPNGFGSMQQELFLGGFYTPSASLEDIAFGNLDDLTLDAYYNLMQWTARYNEAGEDVTTADVLKERVQRMGERMAEIAAKSRAGGGGGNIVNLADPAGLAQGLNAVAQDVLGRKATPDEQRMYVAAFHAMQSGAQSATGGTVVTPDAQGQAEQMLRQQAPVEAQSHDMARTFDSFLKIIGGAR